MELQARDIRIFEFIGEIGTADTDMIRERYFPNDGSGRACQQRLKKLADADLLKRKRIISDDGQLHGGSQPMLYFLTTNGAELVASETGVRPRRCSRSEPKQFTLRHRIEIVRVRLAFDEAAELADLPPVEWIMEQDTDPSIRRSRSRSPSDYLLLHKAFERGDRRVVFRPDAACHIQVPRPSGNGHKSLLAYFEVDLSSEGHRQWERKLWGIEAFLADAKAWQLHWPKVSNPDLVMFVVCKYKKRIRGLSSVVGGSSAAKQVRFALLPLLPSKALACPIWFDADGNVKSILKGK